jgi:hypothetical protein
VRQPRADVDDSAADMIELGGEVRELLFYQRRALVGFQANLTRAPLGRTYKFGCLGVGLLLGPVERVQQGPTRFGERSCFGFRAYCHAISL